MLWFTVNLSKGKRQFLECVNGLSAHVVVQHPDVALLSVLTTCYCIPQEWSTVLHQICSTKNPFDLRCEGVTCYICNMGRKDLPDMYARARRCTVPESKCRHIRQILTTHVTYVM